MVERAHADPYPPKDLNVLGEPGIHGRIATVGAGKKPSGHQAIVRWNRLFYIPCT